MRKTVSSRPESVSLLNMSLGNVDEAGCVTHIMAALSAGRGGWVITSNVDILRRYARDAGFRALAQGASLFVADGMPLIWASKLQGSPLPERVTGSSLITTLSAAAAARGKSVFLLGGEAGTAEAAAAVLRRRCPGLHVAGTYCPAPGFDGDARQMALVRDALCRARPDIVYVALGCPKQERLISAVRECLPCAWWLGIGISFSFLAGRVRRAPDWIQQAGLEWAHRLVQEPRRLARRYLVDGIPFALYLLSISVGVGLRKTLRNWRG
ncbi:MAG: WecB/TagA/CpsF family glycosyltransferase [Pseudomonadota bacterium]